MEAQEYLKEQFREILAEAKCLPTIPMGETLVLNLLAEAVMEASDFIFVKRDHYNNLKADSDKYVTCKATGILM